ncbi:MAG: alpha-hydroxy-acid oxidizing protein, partial [Gemmataceae bacterium]|nr:alpha-hydroxy-acid oxidizing protein [Gemmataceae bacterium]
MSSLDPLINLHDFQARAAAVLDKQTFDYYSRGACDEAVLTANNTCWEKVTLWPKVLSGVTRPDLRSRFFGLEIPMPVLAAPVAMLKMAHPEGELAAARACHSLGIPFIASTMATTSLEEIARATPGEKIFQLYFFRDRGLTRSLIQRAEAAGYRGILLTVDAQILGKREADLRNQFKLPPPLRLENLDPEINQRVRTVHGSAAETMASIFEHGLNWNDLEWLQSETKLPVGLKGILRAEDARRAVGMGIKAIVVSNHGGRQLDCIPTAVEVLPKVVEAVQGRAEVHVDGGIRRGSDVVRALALGANTA